MGWKDAPLADQVPSAPQERPAWASAPEATGPSGSRPLPANAGLAEFLSRTVGLPVDTAENAINLGLAGVGTVATAAGRPDLAPELVRNSFGGSESIRSGLRTVAEGFNPAIAGKDGPLGWREGMTAPQPGLSPDNPTPNSPMGTAQYEFVARGGVLPQGAIPAAASIVAEKTLGPEWAGVGAMAPAAVTTAANAARAPRLQQQQAQNQVRDATLRDAQKAGYVLPPSQVNPTFVGNRLESVAGKAALNQDAVLKNQQVTNGIARREAGLPANAPLTEQTLNNRIHELAEPYRQIAGLSPIAKQALQKLGEARAEAQGYWRHWDIGGDPKSKAQAKYWDERASVAEKVLEAQAKRSGRPELAEHLKVARTNIAKVHDIERALNYGDGNVDARILGRALDRGRPLSGELAVAARFSEAFPQLTRSAAGNPTPGVGALESYAAAGGAIGGGAAFGAEGLLLGAVPFVRPAIRSGLLSNAYQQRYAKPDYNLRAVENAIQSLGRVGVIENEREK